MIHAHAGLPLDGLRPLPNPAQLVSQRIQAVIGTRPGTLPWRRDFGCDLSSLVGQPASSQNLRSARGLIENALGRWLPDVEVERIEVKAVRESDQTTGLAQRNVSIAETALLTLGTSVRLEVMIEVKVPKGTAVVTTSVNP